MKRFLKKNNIDEEMLRLWRNVLSKSWRGVPLVVRENLVDSLLFPYFFGHCFEKYKEVSNFLIFDTQMYNNLITTLK